MDYLSLIRSGSSKCLLRISGALTLCHMLVSSEFAVNSLTVDCKNKVSPISVLLQLKSFQQLLGPLV